MFVIRKSKNPRCFKHIQQLPCTYKNQLKSWMTGDLLTEWVIKLDSFFRAQVRKVAFLVDNCSSHPHIEGLSNINLIFPLPNTTSVLQPMDQGVIRSLKAHYRHKIVRLCIKAVDNNEPMPKISIFQTMKDFVSSWNAVSKETFINCFKKAGISKTNKSIEEADDDHPFKFLTEELNRLRELDPRAVQEDLSAESYIGLDCDVVTTGSPVISKIKKLFSKQKHAVRIILNAGRFTHTKELFNNLQILNVFQLNLYQILIFMYKLHNKISPIIFSTLFNKINHMYSARFSKYEQPKMHYLATKFFIAVRGPKLWNALLSDELKNCSSLYLFKKKIETKIY
ncbi:tigger transposable element-derived protein 4-like [Hydra vulgaris]|uniref:tigger transposable element-derived protein 4-like n=1 Tax=Hydra vulgaris TaxID=6087 RepID=UPI0032EA6484